jgi:EAL domain-containing protein (putative c-di-GMP-specific phosphodiesterase class I)
MTLSVNASGRELQHPLYAATVQDALTASGLSPHQLVVELVESHYDIESMHLVANLHRLRALGVRTAIDDFGTGHSSLDRLRRLGADILKVDRSFVGDIEESGQDVPLVSAVLAMAHALGMRVIAEGVETPAQAEWLTSHGCDFGQGYLFGRPVAGPPSTTPRPSSTRLTLSD